jgi:hypothetical protein
MAKEPATTESASLLPQGSWRNNNPLEFICLLGMNRSPRELTHKNSSGLDVESNVRVPPGGRAIELALHHNYPTGVRIRLKTYQSWPVRFHDAGSSCLGEHSVCVYWSHFTGFATDDYKVLEEIFVICKTWWHSDCRDSSFCPRKKQNSVLHVFVITVHIGILVAKSSSSCFWNMHYLWFIFASIHPFGLPEENFAYYLLYAARWRPYHTHVTARSRLAVTIFVSYFTPPPLKLRSSRISTSRRVLGSRESCRQQSFFYFNCTQFIIILLMHA